MKVNQRGRSSGRPSSSFRSSIRWSLAARRSSSRTFTFITFIAYLRMTNIFLICRRWNASCHFEQKWVFTIPISRASLRNRRRFSTVFSRLFPIIELKRQRRSTCWNVSICIRKCCSVFSTERWIRSVDFLKCVIKSIEANRWVPSSPARVIRSRRISTSRAFFFSTASCSAFSSSSAFSFRKVSSEAF